MYESILCKGVNRLMLQTTTLAVPRSHPDHDASALIVKIRKMLIGPDTPTERDPAQTFNPYPNATIGTDQAILIMLAMLRLQR